MENLKYNLIKYASFMSLKKETRKGILSLFLGEYENRLITIKDAIEEKDNKSIYHVCHKFKGVLLTFCSDEVVNIILELEAAANNNREEQYDAIFEKLDKQVKAAAMQMKEFLNEEA